MSAHAELSPSAAERWLNCTASVRYTQGVTEEESIYAREGTIAHEMLELWNSFGVPPLDGEHYYNLLPVHEWALEHEARGYTVMYEARLSHNDRLWGTGDIVAFKGKKLRIVDEKYGYTPVDVVNNPQLFTYAMCAEDTFKEKFTDIQIGIHQPRIPHRDGALRFQSVTRDQLDWHINEVRQAIDEIDGPDAKFMAGKWCRYCPRLGDCRFATNYFAKLLTGGNLL